MPVRTLICQNPNCAKDFRYVQHKSPNYPKFCSNCARLRMKAGQSVHDERRRKLSLREVPKRALSDVPEEGPKDALRIVELMKRMAF